MEDAGEIGDDGGLATANGESVEADAATKLDICESSRRSISRRRELVCRRRLRRLRRVGADARRRIAHDALKVWQQEPRQQQRQQQLQLQPERLAERQSAAERPRRAAAA